MSDLDILLANEEALNEEIVLTVNETSREIIYDGSELVLLGVAGDYKAKNIYFKFTDTVLNELIDLKNNNEHIKIFVNYQNSAEETYIHYCGKGSADGDGWGFVWELGSGVTAYSGYTLFMVCVKEYDNEFKNVLHEWHTTPCQGRVLEGLNVDNHTPINDIDLSRSIRDFEEKVESLEYKLEELNNKGVSFEQIFREYLENDAFTTDNINVVGKDAKLTEVLRNMQNTINALSGETVGDVTFPTTDDVIALIGNTAPKEHTHQSDEVLYDTRTVKAIIDVILENISKKNRLYQHNIRLELFGTDDSSMYASKARTSLITFKFLNSREAAYSDVQSLIWDMYSIKNKKTETGVTTSISASGVDMIFGGGGSSGSDIFYDVYKVRSVKSSGSSPSYGIGVFSYHSSDAMGKRNIEYRYNVYDAATGDMVTEQDYMDNNFNQGAMVYTLEDEVNEITLLDATVRN